MNYRQTLKKICDIIVEEAGKDTVSIYLLGSFGTKDETKSSDIDINGIMKPSFDFKREKQIADILNERIRSKLPIRFEAMSYRQFFGARRCGSLTMDVPMPIFLNFMKTGKLIYGRKLNFDKFPIKPATPKQELRYHIRIFYRFKREFRTKDKVGKNFTLGDLIKTIFYIANIELQIKRNVGRMVGYKNICHEFHDDRKHVIHDSMKLLRKKHITNHEKLHWLGKSEKYIEYMRTFVTTS